MFFTNWLPLRGASAADSGPPSMYPLYANQKWRLKIRNTVTGNTNGHLVFDGISIAFAGNVDAATLQTAMRAAPPIGGAHVNVAAVTTGDTFSTQAEIDDPYNEQFDIEFVGDLAGRDHRLAVVTDGVYGNSKLVETQVGGKVTKAVNSIPVIDCQGWDVLEIMVGKGIKFLPAGSAFAFTSIDFQPMWWNDIAGEWFPAEEASIHATTNVLAHHKYEISSRWMYLAISALVATNGMIPFSYRLGRTTSFGAVE